MASALFGTSSLAPDTRTGFRQECDRAQVPLASRGQRAKTPRITTWLPRTSEVGGQRRHRPGDPQGIPRLERDGG
jgi:hypothetical protein